MMTRLHNEVHVGGKGLASAATITVIDLDVEHEAVVVKGGVHAASVVTRVVVQFELQTLHASREGSGRSSHKTALPQTTIKLRRDYAA